MRKQEILAVILVILSTVGTIWAVIAYESGRRGPDTVLLLAQAPEKGSWTPRSIRAKQGQKINIEIRNVDVVSHGFYLPSLDIMIREIKAGEVERISMVPDRRGVFPFYCSVWCSDYHMQMRGELVVD